MKRLFALFVPLIALTGCATYGDGYYRDRTVYRDGGYYYPAYEGAGDYYYGADQGYDYDYHYGSGIGYGYGYSPFWGLDRYRCRSYYGCVPTWGGYYPYHYSPGWSFSVGNTWGWGNLGWYGGYRWNNYPRYRPRPDYGRYEPRAKPKPTGRTPPAQSAPYYVPGQPIRRPVVEGEYARNPAYPVQTKPARVDSGYDRPVPKPTDRFDRGTRPYTKPGRVDEGVPLPRTRYRQPVRGEPVDSPRQRYSVPVQPAPARSGGARMRYPEPMRSPSRQAVGQPGRPAPQARPAPMQRAQPMQRVQPMAKPAHRQAEPRPAPRRQVRTTSQNGTSNDEE
ncbi:MAG TPA: hypothetical protein VFY00_08550 [Arenimonas sp.]|nr:hypothetical protein [Arenimonas sp.]